MPKDLGRRRQNRERHRGDRGWEDYGAANELNRRQLGRRHYADKVQIGGDPEGPLQVMHRQVSLSDAQLDALDRFTKSLLVDARRTDAHAV
jgi:hypothetical protein